MKSGLQRVIHRSVLSGAAPLLLAALAFAACNSDADETPQPLPVSSTQRPYKAVDATGLPRPGEEGCPIDGTWHECGLMERLVRSGVAPRATSDTLVVPWMSVPGVRIAIGRSATLTVFYYPDEESAAADAARIDTVRVRPKTGGDTTNVWRTFPNFVRSVNLIAVLESEDPRQIERIMLAVEAGAP